MNRNIAIAAIIAAFIGGMIVTGETVEAKKGGGGVAIEELEARVASLEAKSGQPLEFQLITHRPTFTIPKNTESLLVNTPDCPNGYVSITGGYQQIADMGFVPFLPVNTNFADDNNYHFRVGNPTAEDVNIILRADCIQFLAP